MKKSQQRNAARRRLKRARLAGRHWERQKTFQTTIYINEPSQGNWAIGAPLLIDNEVVEIVKIESRVMQLPDGSRVVAPVPVEARVRRAKRADDLYARPLSTEWADRPLVDGFAPIE